MDGTSKLEGETLGRVSLRLGLDEPSEVRLLHHPQVVGHLEHVWHNVGGDSSQVLVIFGVYIAFQRYPLAFNNDVNARRCLPKVPGKRTCSEQGAIDTYPRLLVEARWWQDLDVVDHLRRCVEAG